MFKTDCRFYSPLNTEKGIEIAHCNECNGDCVVIRRCSLDCIGYKKTMNQPRLEYDGPNTKKVKFKYKTKEFKSLLNKIEELEKRIEKLEHDRIPVRAVGLPRFK
jgi:hypothetical protein